MANSPFNQEENPPNTNIKTGPLSPCHLIPEHIERVARWEAIVSAANKRRVSTFFAALKDPMDVDRPGTYAGIHTVVEWSRTSRGGRQYELFFDGQAGSGCNSDLALCEWDEDRGPAIDLACLAPPVA